MTRNARDHWDEQAPIYASDAGHRRFRRFLDLYEADCWRYIEPTLPQIKGSMILEAGCGTGRWVFRLAPREYQMVLSDLSPQMVQQAREKVERLGLSRHVLDYHALDICDMSPLMDASFDLVLVLAGPLTLCHDAEKAVTELRRVTKPGGRVICDVANRYRTALDLFREKDLEQLTTVLDTGGFLRSDGLTDHRFGPQELSHLFKANGMEAVNVAGICPFFEFLPSKEQAAVLEDETVFKIMLNVGARFAEDPIIVGLSGRLLIVAQKGRETDKIG